MLLYFRDGASNVVIWAPAGPPTFVAKPLAPRISRSIIGAFDGLSCGVRGDVKGNYRSLASLSRIA